MNKHWNSFTLQSLFQYFYSNEGRTLAKSKRNKNEGTALNQSITSLFFHLFRKAFPKGSRLRKGFFGSTVRALPGMIPSTSPYMRAVKQSVVGSGPTLLPGKSCSMRYLKPSKPETPLPTLLPPTQCIQQNACCFQNACSIEVLVLT